MTALHLALALDELHEDLAFWVHYNDPKAKEALLRRYETLPARQRAALERAVEAVFQRQGGTITAYRRMKPGDRLDRLGGASVTTDYPTHGARVEVLELVPEDVLLHWAVTYPDGDTTALGSKAFGHEHEVILRPDARPRHIESGRTDLREMPAEFFHVTASTNREMIRKHGLRPSHGWISGPGAFVTTNPSGWLFMFEGSGIYSDAPAVDIWAVDVSGLELVPDDNETADPNQDFRVVEGIPASRVRLVETIE